MSKQLSRQEILSELDQILEKDGNWRAGRTFSLVYHLSDAHTQFIKDVYAKFFHHNGLNPGVFPSLKRFEAETLDFCIDLFQGKGFAAGTMTSGGSESLMMAVKTARDYTKQKKPLVTAPEMIAAISVHPAVDKAAQYFGIKLIKVPLDADFKMDISSVRLAINPNTIMIVGSATSYPQGVVDPIAELSQICVEKDIWLHVDACLGGFFLPFARILGQPIPEYDFTLPGVKSISADLHKYGFAAKGASIILYRSKELRTFQFFVCTDWNGGLFASPSMTGTRPGGSIAAAWATIKAIGLDGYLQIGRDMITVTRDFRAILERQGCEVIGSPVGPVLSFRSKEVDTFALADQMEHRQWFMDRQQNPTSVHVMLTPNHMQALSDFEADLKESIAIVKARPELAQSGKAAMYGMVAHIPDSSQIEGFLVQYMNERYETKASNLGGGL